MKNSLSHFIILGRRWVWLVILGVVICSSLTYLVSKLLPPTYQANVTLIVDLKSSSTSSYDNITATIQALPTYAKLLSNPVVLDPVVAKHPGITVEQLSRMITVQPLDNTQLVEFSVESNNPQLTTQLANEVGQSISNFAANSNPPAIIRVLSVKQAVDQIKPKILLYTGIGALVGLCLAITLIIVFEWLKDRLAKPEEVQELLGMETLTVIPKLSLRHMRAASTITEACSILCANLNAAQAVKPFKLVMVTSALAGEGKSTVAANLATLLATAGKHVLLVDANLRNPILDQNFQLNYEQGLSMTLLALREQVTMEVESQETDIPTLRVLTAGVLSPHPTELLLSPGAKQLFDYFRKAPFDYIIFDTSPLLSTADTQILANYVQATVLVVDASKTPRSVLQQTKSALNKTHTMLLGVVINKSDWSDNRYGSKRLSNRSRSKAATPMPVPPNTPAADSIEEDDLTASLRATTVDRFVDKEDATVILPRQQKIRESEL